jgi:putative membrane protein
MARIFYSRKKLTGKKKTMKKTIMVKAIFSALLVSAVLFTSCGGDTKTEESKEVAKEVNDQKFDSKASEKDAQFLVDATSASFEEVSIAEVALAKSANAEVKKIAQQLKDEHSTIITELNSVAAQKMITVPAVASDDAGKAATKLNETKAADFDKDWLAKVKDMHESSVKKYENASSDAGDTTIKSWASATLPKIKAHLNMINKARDMMK